MYTCIKSILHNISQSMNMFNHKVYNIVIILECIDNFQKSNLSSYFPCGSYFGSFFLDSFIIEQFSTCNTWYFDADSNVCYNGHTKYLRWLGFPLLCICDVVPIFLYFCHDWNGLIKENKFTALTNKLKMATKGNNLQGMKTLNFISPSIVFFYTCNWKRKPFSNFNNKWWST